MDENVIYGNEVNNFFKSHKLRISWTSPDGWTVRYVDDSTGDLWELTYPHSECHGGGPPLLKRVTQSPPDTL